jgi:hypothetical protein
MDREPVFIFKQSAFKHHFTEADILWAFSTARFDVPMEDAESVYESRRLLVGFNRAGNPIEVMYNELDDGRINVFHAMPCRDEIIARMNQ